MSEQEIRVPDLGGADEVEVIEILISAGDSVAEEDPILTVETDKASVELPSPGAGKIVKITVKVGDKIKEGDVVGILSSDGAGSSDGASDDTSDGASNEHSAPEPESKAQSDDAPAKSDDSASKPAPRKKSGGTRTEIVKVSGLDGFDNIPIIELNVSEGDDVDVESALVTVESDKATMEIPSPFAGKIGKILVKEGDKISEGDDLLEMIITDDGADDGDDADDSAPADSSDADKKQPAAPEQPAAASDNKAKPAETGSVTYEAPVAGSKVHAGPAVRKLARELGADLARVKGSGPKSRIVKDDVHGYVKAQLQQAQQGAVVPGAGTSGIPGVKLPDFSQFGEVEREGMSRMMSVTALNMHRSWLNVPHVTQFEDADISDMEDFRKSLKALGEKKGVKMTPLPFMLKACAAALAELPQFNVALDMDRKEVVHKKYIHIGIAVDTPHGLMVPVIRNVDQKGLWELAAESAELAGKARDKKLKPAEMQGACFTITSLGGIGGTAFTPIVNTPEVAILGVSKAAMKPVWDGKAFQPRLMLPLSLSYDHRAVNGADAARFTSALARLMGDIRTLLL
ncbi:pyruvate dehydrogenase E2 component (dihydrolipoamide acetyltransferase) [Marinobacter sp. LV10R520-4]|uniref:dihydrolipoyllysine-residue acetyltransferase n=1 Tax=Marinobacter sp. LV10R520-4 TaxID=1761796 RepID=UPI000BF4193C|nr:dihydrolipoyllysine-residue acetyltransferase [Marinobacter sp. LV10R520-4]PFG53048.1 pyruvate dehydrogenase E2 component (dihydrolipoamide acetyltransferase) [Marinobacter sp. LV10R520-4]